ncbi:methyltransferase domain-containing protein [Paenibacillus thiaminolyticus]|uniref:class I SAM-dependent methyltransferase n=1 Tax=Paenibacillus thiaminolyticus TaxID=49283 RepID=UPI003D2781D0
MKQLLNNEREAILNIYNESVSRLKEKINEHSDLITISLDKNQIELGYFIFQIKDIIKEREKVALFIDDLNVVPFILSDIGATVTCICLTDTSFENLEKLKKNEKLPDNISYIFKEASKKTSLLDDNTFDYSYLITRAKEETMVAALTELAEAYRLTKNEGFVFATIISNLNNSSKLISNFEKEITSAICLINSDESSIFHSINKKKKSPSSYNLPLTKELLAEYFTQYSDDQIMVDLFLLDLWARNKNLPIVSSGRYLDTSFIFERSYRLWEYRQIIKSLSLDQVTSGSLLDIGGASCHITYYAALRGVNVTSLDINPKIVEVQKKATDYMDIDNLNTVIMDMRDLSAFDDNSFDMVMSASVFEHLERCDQIKAMKEIARVVKPGGKVAISFDYGIPAPGANPDLPPPHDPPYLSSDVKHIYCEETGLQFIGESFSGSIYPFWDSVFYSPAFILLEKQDENDKGNNIDTLNNLKLEWEANKSVLHSKILNSKELNKLISTIIIELTKYAEKTNDLYSEIGYKNTQFSHMEKENEIRLSLINKLSNDIQMVRSDSEKRLSVINKLSTQLETVEHDREERLNLINILSREITDYKHERENYLSDIERLNVDLATCKDESNKYLNDIGELKSTLSIYRGKVSEQKQLIEQFENTLKKINDNIWIKILKKIGLVKG